MQKIGEALKAFPKIQKEDLEVFRNKVMTVGSERTK
jgi:hypothetical protein